MKEGGGGSGGGDKKVVARKENRSKGGKGGMAREGLCYQFMQGHCPWGARCHFQHDPELRGGLASGGDTMMMAADVTITHTILYTTRDEQSPLEILYTSRLDSVEAWVKLQHDAKWFGVDTESKPCFASGMPPVPPSVLQLSTCHSALVFQLNACKAEDLANCATLAPTLFALLFPSASDTRPLVGMAVLKDLMELEEVFGWRLADDPLVGASKDEAKVLKRARHPHLCDMWAWQLGGLLELAQTCTGVTKWKTNSLQLTRWDIFPLKTKSLIYAALDAWAGAAVYNHYINNPPFPEAPPPLPKKPKKPRPLKEPKEPNAPQDGSADAAEAEAVPQTCRKFARGKCTFGDKCRYLHA